MYTTMPVDTDLLIFGQETKGLPPWVLERWPDKAYKIPIFHPGVRSLNIANAVSIVLYDQLMKKTLYTIQDETKKQARVDGGKYDCGS